MTKEVEQSHPKGTCESKLCMKEAVEMGNKWKRLVAICMIAGISWLLVQNPYTDQYVAGLTKPSVVVTGTVKEKDSLYLEIEQSASKYEVAPQDARIDRVWKMVPGLNGLQVNVKDSYKLMKKNGVFDKKKLIFNQIPPAVHMNELEPVPIYRAHPEKPTVSLLINVAWGNEYLQDMLAVLKKHQVKATFFLEGRWTKNNPELAKMIAEGGHEIGNHSYSHPNMERISSQASKDEILKTTEVIKAVTGRDVTWFAPPSGSFREETVKIADSLGLNTVLWSVDTIDWQKPSPELLQKRVLSKIHPGAFVLMHPTESTANSLDQLITEFKKQNFHVVTVTEAVDEKRIVHTHE